MLASIKVVPLQRKRCLGMDSDLSQPILHLFPAIAFNIRAFAPSLPLLLNLNVDAPFIALPFTCFCRLAGDIGYAGAYAF